MPHGPFSSVGPRALIRAKHVTELQDALQVTPTLEDVTTEITTTVVPMVTAALADSDTIEDAFDAVLAGADIPGQVETAVDADIAGRNLLESTDAEADDWAWGITDEADRRSWVEGKDDGTPTTHAASLIARATAPVIADEGLLDGLLEDLPDESGFVFALTDADGRLALGVRPDGSTTLAASATASGGTLPITGWGTSMMEGSTGSGTTLLTALADELDLPSSAIDNHGVSGMRSPGIAAQQGGSPAILLVDGGEIPGSGAVDVEVDAAVMTDTFYAWFYGSPIAGTLQGIPGTLDYPAGVDPAVEGVPAVFTRTGSGDPEPVPGPRPFLPDAFASTRRRFTIFWAGHNDQANLTQVQDNYRKMVTALAHDDYLILGETHAYVAGDDDALNDWLASEFPWAFVDLKAWMVSERSLTSIGLTPTADDLADIAAGLVPRTLRPVSDVVHFNANGYRAAAKLIAPIITEKGWV